MYNTKIIQSGGHIEIYKMYNYHVRDGKRSTAEVKLMELEKNIEKDSQIFIKENTIKTDKELNKLKSRNRAKNKILRLVRSNSDMTTFITLTFQEEPKINQAKTYLNTFFTKLRKDNKNLKYLWVLEKGDRRGRIHYHVLCNLNIKISLQKSTEKKSEAHKKLEQEFANKYWQHGIVDIRKAHKAENSNLALYVSTYLVKSLQNVDLDGMRIYGYSRKTLKKPTEVTYLNTKENIEDILSNFGDYRIKYQNSYSIGYKENTGHVLYLDLIKKE